MPGALSTDLYEITMSAGYYVHGETGRATFELWVRELPPQRGYLVAAGLEQALTYLEGLRLTPDEIVYLRELPALRDVPAGFFDAYLPTLRFTGDVWAVPEGTPVFAQEPLLRVTAPLPEAQIVETALLSTVLFQTSIASKAARVVSAARGRPVVEFGARRAHGTEAAALVGRAAFIGGCAGTSAVESGFRFGIPVSGTMAHSWVMTHVSEMEAFRRFEAIYGDQSVLLIDTYDTVEAARGLARAGLRPAAVRLDSGDLAVLSKDVRQVLDETGLHGTRIFASGDLDEHRVAELVDSGAPIDAFGVGTALSTSIDVPALTGVYKLVEIERDEQRVPTMKLSPGKRTYPGRKQVWRVHDASTSTHDVLGIAEEVGPPDADPLLCCVMRDGRRETGVSAVTDLQARCAAAVGGLPVQVRRLEAPESYRVVVSAHLDRLSRAVARRLEQSAVVDRSVGG